MSKLACPYCGWQPPPEATSLMVARGPDGCIHSYTLPARITPPAPSELPDELLEPWRRAFRRATEDGLLS